MKVLLDTCVWGGSLRELATQGYDVLWAGDWPSDPGDEEILARAHRESRTLVTLDKDFGDLAIIRGMPHCGIVRLVDIPARQQTPHAVAALQRYGAEFQAGAIVTVTTRRVRIRSAS
jgi:predicted nuclease of predicted toxin-antitoxin system